MIRAVLAEAIMQQLLGAMGDNLDVSFASASVGPAPAGDSLMLGQVQLCNWPPVFPTLIKLAACVDYGNAVILDVTTSLACVSHSQFLHHCCGNHEGWCGILQAIMMQG